MSKNAEINAEIRRMIDASSAEIFKCKGHNDPNILVYDGIISHGDNTPEILFLLKEANDGRDSSHGSKLNFSKSIDFTEIVLQDARNQTEKKPTAWDNLCYWTKVFQDAKIDNLHYFLDESVQTCGGYLSQLSIVNIKKVPGASSVEDINAIEQTSRNEICANLIIDEIAHISPNVVVCCGTYDYARIIYKISSSQNKSMKCGLQYFITSTGIVFVEFIHPTQYGAAAKRALTYAYAKEVFGEMKKENLI